jgi:enoyl-CoA hydratase
VSTVTRERVREGVDLVTLNRPERLNAINNDLIADLTAALQASSADSTCRALVLTGAGRAFCAGLDLKEMIRAPGGNEMGLPQRLMHRAQRVAGIVPEIRQVAKPIVAAVNGAAAGGGFSMALACDVRVASDSARFNAAFIKIGVSGCDLGLSWTLPRLVGASRAFELMLTGRMVDAAEADRIGLVARVVPDDQVVDAALETAELIASHSPFGVWMTKEVMWTNLEVGSFMAAIDLENRTQVLGLLTEDHQEAVTAFLDKRPPVYSNR